MVKIISIWFCGQVIFIISVNNIILLTAIAIYLIIGSMNIQIADTEIAKQTGIPYQTLMNWKKQPLTNWRGMIYFLLHRDTELITMIASAREKDDD